MIQRIVKNKKELILVVLLVFVFATGGASDF